MNVEKIAEAVKNHLVKLASKGMLPMHISELSIKDLAKVIEKAMPSNKDKAIDLASHYLSDGDLTTEEMIKAIAKHENQNDLIDNVEGVVVWQKVEYSFTCEEFLNEIGY